MKKRKQPNKYRIVIRWSPEDDCYVSEVPELPGCASDGMTEEEALNNACDAIRSWMKSAKKHGNPIPTPLAEYAFSGKFNVRVAKDLHQELAFKALEQKVSLNHLINRILSLSL